MVVDQHNRKRKAHTKSRQGCGNCKLRRVKCDESKPDCQRCQSSGFQCDYESNAPELQIKGADAFQVNISSALATPPDTPPKDDFDVESLVSSMMNAPLYLHVDPGTDGPDIVYLDKPHLSLLRKFCDRSVLTIGTKESMHVYRKVMSLAASRYAYALHAILRFALIHDRFVYDPIGTKPSEAEAFHGYHAAALFSQAISKTEHSSEEKDALWATAAVLGATAFTSIEATSPQEAWPLRPPSFEDLDWLKMSDGKREVWKMTNPLREGSAFRPALELEEKKDEVSYHRAIDPNLDLLFPYVTKLYNLETPANDDSPHDPYREAASIITRLLPIDATHSTIMWFLSFLGHMDPEYRRLLEAKDPAALLLLAWWYAKLIPYSVWWLTRRAMLECQAICLYLDQTLEADHDIRKLLEYPKSVCFSPAPANTDC
ncbi:putative zn(2)-C6 fungal-type DNA-binding domain-containing protein [Septoria linicola]|nr:putative zn(2)-C6 fungal-type DNA-binding domain-containing protein [Septoria linicola]